MRNYSLMALVLVLGLLLNACTPNKKNAKYRKTTTIENPYFGEKEPGLIPTLFAPGVISLPERYEHSVSFSPALDEMYFTASKKDQNASIYYTKLQDKKWLAPQKANFTKGNKKEEMQGFVTHKGDKIYFTAYDSIFEDERIWYVDRLKNSWSEAKKLESPINNDLVFYPNQAKNGDLYYFNISKRKSYYAPYKNGNYPEIKEVGIEFGVHAFMAPSQDYIVVNSRNKEDEQRKDSEIYVYFKKKDGSWSKPINLGSDVNSTFPETCPSITPDGNYLFFGRYNEKGGESDLYWVSTKVIEKLRPTNL